MFLNGAGIPTPSARGSHVLDDSFYLALNAHHEPLEFVLPQSLGTGSWDLLVDTDAADSVARMAEPGDTLRVAERSSQLWIRPLGRVSRL